VIGNLYEIAIWRWDRGLGRRIIEVGFGMDFGEELKVKWRNKKRLA
jgi:hypothetical protein